MSNTPVRVLNKDIWEKLDRMEARFQDYRLATESRMTYLETVMGINQEEIKGLRKLSSGAGIIAVVGSTVAGILGYNN